MSPAFDDILDLEYTRNLEEDLDKIEEGEENYESTLSSFYKKFAKDLKRAAKEMPNLKEGVEPTPPVTCDKCGKPMVIKAGKFGLFLACSGYPECENTRELETPEPGAEGEIEENCENCGKPMAVKRGRFGQFLACTGYPECKTTRKLISTKQGLTAAKPDQLLDEKCPKCESQLVLKHGRFGEFTACSNYPTCKYVKQKSTGVLARRTAATSSNASRAAARCSSAAPTIPTATSRSGTARSRRSAPTAARRSWSRRSPSGTAVSWCATTRTVPTCAPRN